MRRCICNHFRSQHTGDGGGCAECLCPEVHDSPLIEPCLINGRWQIQLPAWRSYRPEWPVWEKERTEQMASLIARLSVTLTSRKPSVIDVGAEQGDLPALWAQLGADVSMIEPNPANWPVIRTCFDANGLWPGACYVGFAASDDWDGRPDFDATPVGGWPRCAMDEPVPDAGFRHLSEMGVDVGPRIRLDTFCRTHQVIPDIVTIDIEGAELEALKGAKWMLSKPRPHVLCSVHPEFMVQMHGQTADELDRFMETFGYDKTILAVDHETHVWWQPL